MSEKPRRTRFRHGLSFIAILAFLASFFGSRLFASLLPTVVVESQGIHFHHFWYGIAMISAAGWLGIVSRTDRFDRTLALVYGLGAGFIGDEIGLLLTFGDYRSELTYLFFVGAASFIILALLLLEYGDDLQKEVLNLSVRERISLLGLFLAGFSTIFFAFGQIVPGVLVVAVGIAAFLVGFELRRKLFRLRTT